VADFQTLRGLHSSGICDEQTWLALIEAGWKLGDRLLVLKAPHLRGDDVASLQSSLNHVGFDCGRPDGILGQSTARAIGDFQRNSGLTADGICGSQTIQMLAVVSRQSGTGPGVASVRESETMLSHDSLRTLRVVVGQFGGLSSIARALSRALREGGAKVMSTDEYEAAVQAAAANRYGATLYIGFEAVPDKRSTISYFAVPTFESIGGRALAKTVSSELSAILDPPPDLQGMRLAVLRETRMPAVLCSLGPVRDVVDSTDAIVEALVVAVSSWGSSPLGVTDDMVE
jgi:N-acetylmuramoyl-L-alanine amidase